MIMALVHPVHHSYTEARPGLGLKRWRDRFYGQALFHLMALLEHPILLRIERLLGGNGRPVTKAEDEGVCDHSISTEYAPFLTRVCGPST